MFVIIVLFLIANFSATGEILNMTKDIQLPTATHVDELELAPVVMVSNDDVIINGVVGGPGGGPLRDDYLTIPALEEKLREQKKETEELHALANDGTAFKGVVNIQGHKDVPFKIIKRVMFSCQRGGYGNINFAVLRGAGVSPARRPPPCRRRRPDHGRPPTANASRADRVGAGLS